MKTKLLTTLLAVVLLAPLVSHSATTKVGNGDDGSDLEGFEEITSGPIFESRKKAVAEMKRLNIEGVPGLGILIPEVERAQLYMAKKDVQSDLEEDQGAFHADFNGAVFARTIAEPYSPTRFFPAAKNLSEDQLIALQIHEGLHRALPPSIRENERKVAQLTLAITSPGANYDRIRNVAVKVIPEAQRATYVAQTSSGAPIYLDQPVDASMGTMTYPIPDNAKIKRPSILSYTYQAFNNRDDSDLKPVQSIQTIQSYLYPFGGDNNPIGIGIEASVINFQNSTTKLGPLGLSIRERLWSIRGFDIGAWATASLNTLSDEELKDSPYGRDVLSLGFSSRKDVKNFYVENMLGVTSAGQVQQKLGTITYTHNYGAIVNASVKAGAKIGRLVAGGYAELLLGDNYELTGPGYDQSTGRYQILGAGPDIGWEEDWWAARIYGRYVVESTQNANYTYLGDLLGQGVGQGSIGLQLSVTF